MYGTNAKQKHVTLNHPEGRRHQDNIENVTHPKGWSNPWGDIFKVTLMIVAKCLGDFMPHSKHVTAQVLRL